MLPCRVDFQSRRAATLFEELGIGEGFCTTFRSSSRVLLRALKVCVSPGLSSAQMSKKIVIKADLVGKACMSDILSVVATLQGIKSMEIDADKCTLTVVGAVDPVRIAQKLKKKCFAATIISVADDKPKPPEPEKKDPCKEACEKLCKERCDKIACCKECKDKCEKACKERCERRCKAWIEGGSCSCGRCCRTSPGFCYTPGFPYCGCGRGCGGWPGPFGC